MRCAFLTASISRLAGGLFVATRELAQTLQGRGVEIAVLGVRDRHADEDQHAWQGLNMHLFDPQGPAALAYAPGYRAALEQMAPDLAHCHGIWQYPSMACATWAGRTGRPYVVSPHGMLDPWALANAGLKKRLAAALFQRRHLQRATCLHALCDAEAAAMRVYGLTNPIAVIPNGIALPEAAPNLPPPWPVEVVAGRNVLLFLGRLHPKKGLPHLLTGWQELLRDLPGTRHTWCIVIAGWDQGGHRAELEHQAATLGIADSLCFTGPLYGDRKASAFAHAHAFVLPSFSEGMPAAILEAWSYGLPVVMTPQCNIPQGIIAKAAIAMSADTRGAREALRLMVNMSPDERNAMGNRGRQLVQDRFTWVVVAEQMQRVYEWAVTGGVPPACVQIEQGQQ